MEEIKNKQTKQQKFTIREALKFGWETTTENFIFLLGVILVVYIWQFSSEYFLDAYKSNMAISIPLNVLFYAITTFLSLGLIKISLKFANKEKPRFEDLFSCQNYMVKKILADIVYCIMVIVGLLLLVVPGIYLAMKYGFYGQLIVDKDMSPMAAFKASGEITQGAKMSLFLLLLVLTCLNILGLLFFVIGILFTIPMTILSHIYVYKKLSSSTKSLL